MIALRINGEEAVIKKDTTIRLTRNNPLLTNSGDFTFDVQLPLAGCRQNQKIFGLMFRPEMQLQSWVGKRLKAEMISNSAQLSGAVKVTSITNEEAKVQFIAGLSELKDKTSLDNIKVNNLELGNCWDTFDAWYDGVEGWFPGGKGGVEDPRDEMERIFYWQPQVEGHDFTVQDMMWGDIKHTDAVLFPLYLEDEDLMINPYIFKNPAEGYLYRVASKSHDGYLQGQYKTPIAPMPYLSDIIKRIIEAIGYELKNYELLLTEPYSRLIIISTRTNTIKRAATLPDWSVTEFIEQVENMLGLFFDIDDNKQTITIRKRCDIFNTDIFERYELTEVSDEFTVDINEDEVPVKTFEGNVIYDADEEIPAVLFPNPEIYEKAIVVSKSNYQEVYSFFSNLGEETKEYSPYILIDEETGMEYAILRTTPRALKIEPCTKNIGATKEKEFSSYKELKKWFNKTAYSELKNETWLLSIPIGRFYTITDAEIEDSDYRWELKRIAQYGGIWRNRNDYSETTEIKIVPARVSFLKASKMNEQWIEGEERLTTPEKENAVPVLSTKQPLKGKTPYFSVDREINPDQTYYEGEEEENGADNSPEYLQVAYYDPEQNIKTLKVNYNGERELPFAVGMTYGENIDNLQYEQIPQNKVTLPELYCNGFFSLKEYGEMFDQDAQEPQFSNTVGKLIAEFKGIHSGVERVVEFISTKVRSPIRVFLIRGKKYLCRKFEINISNTTESPIKKGYFIEIDDENGSD